MIKLKYPLNYRGVLYQSGDVLPVSPELAAKMVEAKTAELFTPVEPEPKPGPGRGEPPKKGGG